MLGGPQGRSGQVRKISPPPGFDPRTVRPVGSRYTDWAIAAHPYLLISKICLPHKGHTFIKISARKEEIFRVHLLEDPSIKLLYQRRLEQNSRHSPYSLNSNEEWQTLKNTLQQAANETLGKRKKKRHKRRLILWNGDIKNLVENKKKAY